jgi:hypothetical protein
MGWIDALYLQPSYHFPYFSLSWIQPWPGGGMYLHFALLALASLGVALGFHYRGCIVAFFVLFTYVELIDLTTYLNHYYLVSLLSFLMIFLPLHRTASIDAWRSPNPGDGQVPTWVLWVLRMQLAAVYVFAGIAKLNPDWLLGALPLRIWLHGSGDYWLLGTLLQQDWLAYVMSWLGAAFDLTIVVWLLWARSRPFAYLVMVAFHAATAFLFPNIGLFPLIMATLMLVYFPPDWPTQVWRRLRHPPRLDQNREVAASLTVPVTPRWQRRALAGLLTGFALIQIALPFRHLAYPGDVLWTEEGYRFSWRVLLTEKAGTVSFRVHDPVTGKEWLVLPEDYLTPTQVERMAYQPDLILRTAHIIAEDFQRRGQADVEVRADAFVSLNGRPSARLLDPEIDLAAQQWRPGHKDWVLPRPEA